MEHTHKIHPINKLDNRLPLILVGVALGAIFFTLGESMGWHWQHFFHNKTVHLISNHYLMWIFFAFLGVEIRVRRVIEAGKFVGLATLGGMIIPPLFAYLLTQNVYIAMGAMATDVAFSLAAGKFAQGGKEKTLVATIIALMILAVGDDMGGVAVIAGTYAENVDKAWLFIAIGSILFTYFVGERGRINFTIGDRDGENIQRKSLVIRIRSISFWIILAIANSVILYFAGVEWILGGCLAFLLAPSETKDKLAQLLEPIIPIVLLLFGMVNGAINILSTQSWGLITVGALVGGMGGKQIGIFFFGLVGRLWTKRTDPSNKYGHIHTRHIYSLALLGSPNGTVAIFFVASALAKGFISDIEASQAILGYFLTVPAVFIIVAILKPFRFFNVEEPEERLISYKKALNE